MASLKKNVKKNGEVVYRIQITIYDKVSHKNNAKVLTFKPNQNSTPKQQEKEAQKYAMEWEDKLKNGESYEGEEMSFAEFAEKWLESRKEDLAYSTYTGYVTIVNNKIVPALGRYKVARIKPPVIEEFYKTLLGTYSNGSIQKVKNVLSGMFRTAVRWQMIQVNPCRDAKVAKNKEEETTLKYFTPEQSLMFLRSLDMEFETVIRGHERIDDTGKPYCVADYTESRKLPLQLKVFYTISLYCGLRKGDDDDKIRLNQRKPSKYKGLRRFGPEKNLQRINKFMKERPIFYKNLIQMKENIRFYLRCFYCITKVMILQFNSENRTELARNG